MTDQLASTALPQAANYQQYDMVMLYEYLEDVEDKSGLATKLRDVQALRRQTKQNVMDLRTLSIA